MKKIVIFQHAGSGNHGCEALAYSIVSKLNQNYELILFSENINEDKYYSLKEVQCNIQQSNRFRRKSFRWYLYQFNKYLLQNSKGFDKVLSDNAVLKYSNKVQAFLAIGGDNYCYDKGRSFWPTDNELVRLNNRLILVGASIEPEDLDEDFVKHLKQFEVIIARESITYNALIKNHINTKLLPDIGFILPKQETELPNIFNMYEVIGINVSPMIIDKEKCSGIVLKNYEYLINCILKNERYAIALIPHVVWDNNNDLEPLRKLFAMANEKNKKRIALVEDTSCKKTKYVISKCKFLVASRTHASIAAYSTGVPTLVVGYSVKAKGIAYDIFGEYEHYVKSVQTLQTREDLYHAFCWILDNEKNVREKIALKMENYKERAEKIGQVIRNILE